MSENIPLKDSRLQLKVSKLIRKLLATLLSENMLHLGSIKIGECEIHALNFQINGRDECVAANLRIWICIYISIFIFHLTIMTSILSRWTRINIDTNLTMNNYFSPQELDKEGLLCSTTGLATGDIACFPDVSRF